MVNLLRVFGLSLLLHEIKSEKKLFDVNFQQNDYQIKFEHADVISYNKEYIQHLAVTTFKYNRTCTALNVTITYKVDVGNDLEGTVQAHKFASNEYRLFPMRFQFKLCDAVSKNAFGFADLGKCGNFKSCHLEKGKTYNFCNFVPDTSRFPPLIPNGRFMLELRLHYCSIEICFTRAYIEISRPLV